MDRAWHWTQQHVVIVCTSSTRPTTPAPDMLIYETDTERVTRYDSTGWRYYDGTGWRH